MRKLINNFTDIKNGDIIYANIDNRMVEILIDMNQHHSKRNISGIYIDGTIEKIAVISKKPSNDFYFRECYKDY